MKSESLYETVLEAAGQTPLPSPRPPRASAAVVLWRRRADELEVFWIQRSEKLAFMGGWHAFPGGALARTDADVPVVGTPEGAAEAITEAAAPETLTAGLEAPPPHLEDGILACALRELLEETGVLPLPELFEERSGETAPRAAGLSARLAAARRHLLEDEKRLGQAISRFELGLDASRLVFAGRWLTPPFGPRRFDNRFFLLEWPEELPVQPLVVPGEAAYGEWVKPAQALERWRSGAVMTAPPILHLLKVLSEDGPESGHDRLIDPKEANLGPFRRIEFRPGFVMLPLPTPTLPPASHTNTFFLGHGDFAIVDPGTPHPDQIDRLVAAVEAAESAGGRAVGIWLTHHHPDHVGGVAELVERLELPVAAHPETIDRLPGLRFDHRFEDGEEIVLEGDPAMKIRVLHTPGHARGHVCFLDESSRHLLAGDITSAVSTIVIDPPEGDMDQYLASLEQLIELQPATLFPAHGPPLRDGTAALVKLVQHRLDREERILAAWDRGVRALAALREEVYEDLPPMIHPLAERQVRAHLERLERAGRIR